MAVTVTHATAADGTFSASGTTAWDEAHTVAGLGTMAEQAAADYTTTAGLTAYLASPPAIGGTAAAAVTGTTVTATTAFSAPDGLVSAPTYRFDGESTVGWYQPSASAWAWTAGANATLQLTNNNCRLGSGGQFAWTNAAGATGGSVDTAMGRAAANSILFGISGTAGVPTSRTEINKTVTGITDAAATATFTVTIPNAAHTATVEFELTGIIGAGGAIGAHEAAATTSGKIIVTRTAGVNAVASAVSTAFGAVAANVAGATTVTVAAAVSAISGAVGATNTFTINVTITKAGGSSANHICLCYAKVMNANASGVTIA
jgi:hypothetical protein